MVRISDGGNSAQLAPLVKKLWPEHSVESLERIVREYASDAGSCIYYTEQDGEVIGIALCALRHDYVEGCSTSPIGYLEGVYVSEAHSHGGIAKELCSACEAWAKELGCREFASDCELTNAASLAFHLAVGFTEENRLICFRKEL